MHSALTEADDYYMLLAVRSDGVAPVVDLMPSDSLVLARLRAQAMLSEHESCSTVEVWRDGALLDQISR